MKTTTPRGEQFIADLLKAMPDGRSELNLDGRIIPLLSLLLIKPCMGGFYASG